MTMNATTAFKMVNETANFSTDFTANNMTWTVTSVFNIVIPATALLTNLSVILLFFGNSYLRTPFAIYLVNLLVANTLCSLLYYPLEVMNDLYARWWAGSAVCTLYLYGQWMMEAGMFNAHALIALNRLWAITFPVSYRQHHTKPGAVVVCLVMWVYVHLCLLPGLLLDAIYYRLPEETNGCLVNTDADPVKLYYKILQVIVYVAPEVVVMSAYPVICYKTIRRNRRKVRPLRSSQNVLPIQSTQASSSRSIGFHEGENDMQRRTCRLLCWIPLKARNEHGFLMLTLMTLTIAVCYTPNNLYFTTLVLFGINLDTLYLPATILYELNAVLDPLWFVLALPDFRTAFRRTYLSR